MVDIELKYRRFQDFGTFIGSAIMFTMVGCLVKYGSEGRWMVLLATRIGFYFVLAYILYGLLLCIRRESPLPWLNQRTKKELSIATSIGLITIMTGLILFELV